MLTIRNFTDPTCPFAYAAEPFRLKLKWLYGDQITWQDTMLVLSSTPEDNEKKHFTPAIQAKVLKRISTKHLMPMDVNERERVAVSRPISQAYIAIKRNQPEQAEAFLRQARIASMKGLLVDELSVIDEIAQKLAIEHLDEWVAQPETTAQLEADMQDSRTPSASSLALPNKLSKILEGAYRYSSPTYRFQTENEILFEVPGFWTEAVYKLVLANLVPELTKRPVTTDVTEVLQWANIPLSTQEIAIITEVSFEETKAKLKKVAELDALGEDGFWSLMS